MATLAAISSCQSLNRVSNAYMGGSVFWRAESTCYLSFLNVTLN